MMSLPISLFKHNGIEQGQRLRRMLHCIVSNSQPPLSGDGCSFRSFGQHSIHPTLRKVQCDDLAAAHAGLISCAIEAHHCLHSCTPLAPAHSCRITQHCRRQPCGSQTGRSHLHGGQRSREARHAKPQVQQGGAINMACHKRLECGCN